MGEWEGESDGNGTFVFEAGPFTVHETDEETLITTVVGDGRRNTAQSHNIDYTVCPEEPEEDPPAEPEQVECPPVELDGFARSDGSIYVNASGLHATDFEGELALMRGDGGDSEQVASLAFGSQSFVDTDTEVGTTYTYELVLESETCGVIEITAIPVFPTVVAGAAAVGVSMLGYMALRRRR